MDVMQRPVPLQAVGSNRETQLIDGEPEMIPIKPTTKMVIQLVTSLRGHLQVTYLVI